jgi:hypothetical protein
MQGATINGWLDRTLALAIARAVKFVAEPKLPVKAVHVQGLGTGGRVKITLFLKPLGSREIPEPEPYVFGSEEL